MAELIRPTYTYIQTNLYSAKIVETNQRRWYQPIRYSDIPHHMAHGRMVSTVRTVVHYYEIVKKHGHKTIKIKIEC